MSAIATPIRDARDARDGRGLTAAGAAATVGRRPAATHLRLVRPPRPSRARFLVRRALVLLALVALVLGGAAALGLGRADAGPADPVGGHVVLRPGETLWDVAVATAPAGVDARDQLARLRTLNGFDGGALAPWTVVLLPSR